MDSALEAAREVAERYAGEGYRVLALADAGIDVVPDEPEDAEQGLQLVGIVAMADPPRESAAVAIRESVPILHADADFDVLDRHAVLQIHAVGS